MTARRLRAAHHNYIGGNQMKELVTEAHTCPKCGRTYTERPALSRSDNNTLICPDCGTREALETMGIII